MPTDPVTPKQPPHPMAHLTTAELSTYRRQIEHAIKGISPDAPIQADLRRKLAEILTEQDERLRIARANGS